MIRLHKDKNETSPYIIARSSFYDLLNVLATLGLPNVYEPMRFSTERARFTNKYWGMR